MTMDISGNKERRQSAQRRQLDSGPPADMTERRVNIERRLFDFDVKTKPAGSQDVLRAVGANGNDATQSRKAPAFRPE